MANSRRRRTAVAEAQTRVRYDELKQMLEDRRHELQSELHGKMRGVRADGSEKPHEVLDEAESAEVDSQQALDLALIQMKAETLSRISEALARLEQGTYGRCFECGGDIAEVRLRALPFAVRCRHCEEAREVEQLRERMRQRNEPAPLGLSMRGPGQ